MTKKNLGVNATYRVLGKDLSKTEALELYHALRSALNISDVYYPYQPYQYPYNRYPNTFWYGNATTTSSNSLLSNDCSLGGQVTSSVDSKPFTSSMVEVID